MIVVEFLSGPQAGTRLQLTQTWITFGRAAECHVALEDPQSSWEHCVLEKVAGGWQLTDLGSSNGTFVEGERVTQPVLLHPGNTLRLGNTELRLSWLEAQEERTAARAGPHPATEIAVAAAGRALNLTVVSTAVRGGRVAVTGPWAAVGSAAGCHVQLPGIPPHAAHFVEQGELYALQGVEGADVVLKVGGRPIEGPTPVHDDALVEIGPHTLKAAYGAPVPDSLSANETPSAAVGAGSPGANEFHPDLDRTLGVEDIDVGALAGVIGGDAGQVVAAPDWDALRPTETVVLDRPPHEDDPPVPREVRLRHRFHFLVGPHVDRQVFLGTEPVVFGRAASSQVMLFDALVSRRHLSVRVDPRGFVVVEDLGGRNAVSVNGTDLPPKGSRALEHGDLVTIGASVLEYGKEGIDPEDVDTMATVRMPPPRFCIAGTVIQKPLVTIGRDPTSDVFLEGDDEVDRTHCELEFRVTHFSVTDRGQGGTFLNGNRVVEAHLSDGDELRLGGHSIRVGVDGFACSLDIARPQSTIGQAFVASPESADPFMTMCRIAIPKAPSDQTEEAAGEDTRPQKGRKKIFWQPPGDVLRSARVKIAAAVGGACALGLVATLALVGSPPFAEVPPSPAHNSAAFVERAGGQAGCATCHVPLGKPPSEACAKCHEGHAPKEVHAQKGVGCVDCHTEHPTGEPPTALVARGRCDACHTREGAGKHEGLLAGTKGPPTVEAPAKVPALKAGVPAAELHAKHAAVPGRCNACHASAAHEKVDDPRTTCLRCHGEPEQFAAKPCGECHSGEHDAAPVMAAAAAGQGPFGGGGGGFAYAFLLFLPLFLAIGAHRALSRRRPEEAPDAPAALVEPDEPRKLIHISEDTCVGGGECVAACPYDVLRVVTLKGGRKVAKVVNFDSCNECGTCEQACRPNALTRRLPGAPIPTVPRPDVDKNFVTNVPGMYLIGEAMGMSLIRNGNNLGARTVRHIVWSGVQPGAARQAGLDYEVVVVGSGPAGLSAGLTALQEGLSHAVFEKGEHWAQTIFDFQYGKHVQNQPSSVEVIGALPVAETNREGVLKLWDEHLAQFPDLNLVLKQEITDIKALAGPDEPCAGFEITGSGGLRCTAARVVLAVGARGNPNKLRVPGEDLDKVRNLLRDPEAHDGDHIAVVGTGNAGLEVAQALAEANGGSNTVTLLNTGVGFPLASKRNAEIIGELVASGRIVHHELTGTEEIFETEIRVGPAKDRKTGEAKRPGESFTIRNDYVYTMIGAAPPRRWLEKIGVRYEDKPQGWIPSRSDDQSFLETARDMK